MFTRIKLPYELNALERGGISRETMNIHYNFHHKAYEVGLKNTLEKLEIDLVAQFETLGNLLKNLKQLPVAAEIKEAIRFYGGGLLNHNFFFSLLAVGKDQVKEEFFKVIVRDFGSLEKLKKELIEKALILKVQGQIVGSG